jgi:2,3-diketo-5-methylthiopentyl-1-phosphate enolase
MPVRVTYQLPKGADPARLGNAIAVGQTAGSWTARWEHRKDRFVQHLAEVVATETSPAGYPIATVSFPDADVEGDLSSLLVLIFGKMSMYGAIKVIDLDLPPEFGRRPRWGISGFRTTLGVPERPFVMAIFKPALGLSATEHGEILEEVAKAGIDLVKDDEIMADLRAAPTLERARAGRAALDRAAQVTGKRPLYAVNVTPGPASALDMARRLEDEGANALLVNGLALGWHTVEQIRDHVALPILLHPSLAGAWCGAPEYGFSYHVVLGTLAASSGVDAVLYPAHYGNLPFDPTEEARIRDVLRSRGVAPVPSAGIHPGVVPRALADYGTDVVLNAGTGIMDHPDGPAAGVAAFFQALELAHPGQRFDLGSVPDGPLRRALETWGTG